MWKAVYLKVFGVGRSLNHTLQSSSYPSFIFCRSSNPPAISLALLCCRSEWWNHFFFAPRAETHFQAIWPLAGAYLTVWETKSMSHFHGCLSLWCCEFVTACYLPSPPPPHIQAGIDGGFRGIWGCLAHVLLYEGVPVWSPFGPRKWSRCKASGSHNPVGHLPCCSCTAHPPTPLQNPQRLPSLCVLKLS